MKISQNRDLMRYVNEFFYYGKCEGFFDDNQIQEYKTNIMNLDLIIDNELPGDAYIEGNLLKINAREIFRSEEKASLVLFHEFAHRCSALHKDMFNNYGRLEKFYAYMGRNYSYGNSDRFVKFGALMLDEVIAENTAEQLVARKMFNGQRKRTRGEEKFGIRYVTNMDYYSIAQDIAERFAQTLFMPQREQNLNGLSKDSFKKDFVERMILQHCESREILEEFYEIWYNMGTICVAEEQSWGRCRNRTTVSDADVRHAYYRLEGLLREGRENRETIPNNCRVPF